ncbi:MAG: hypothetical protein ACYC8T_26315 [Myxococcaceae bacterium]
MARAQPRRFRLLPDGPAPRRRAAAHERFRAGDFAGTARAVKQGLMDAADAHDAAAQSNLLELLDKVFEVRKGAPLPVDFEVPPELSRLRVLARHGEDARDGKSWYQLDLGAEAKPGTLRNIRIERYPSTVLIDKRAGIGAWEETPEGPSLDIWGASECGQTPVPDGLYLITIEIEGKPKVSGWFALNHHSSSALPYLNAPTPGSEQGATPVFQWEDFRSPENRPWERRVAALLVFELASDKLVWTDFIEGASRTESAVGRDGEGAARLAAGSHRGTLRFMEGRRFGDLHLARDSSVRTIFTVGK